MNTRAVITTTLLILVLLGGGYFYYVNYYTGPYSPQQDDDRLELFPDFGTSTTTQPSTGTSTTPGDQEDDDDQTDEEGGVSAPPIYQQLTEDPVAGAKAIEETITLQQGTSTQTQTRTLIRYRKRENGHIFQTNPQKQSTVRISNTTVPGIQRTYFSDDGEQFISQYLASNSDILRTVVSTLTEDGQSGRSLPQNITDIAFSPDDEQIFYIRPTENGSVGVLTSTATSNPRTIFNSRLQEWLVQWPTDNTINLTTKPAARVNGVSWRLSANGGTNSLISEKPGLMTLTSPDGQRVLYARNEGPQPELQIYNTQTNESQQLSFSTFPDKCVWADATQLYCAVPQSFPDATYPRAWYQGRISFNDRIVSINARSGVPLTILEPQNTGNPAVDATRIDISSDNKYLYFINKKDGSLWSLDIPRARGEGFEG